MKFKVEKKSKLLSDLIALRTNMFAANKSAFALAKQIGFSKIRIRSMVLAGGISSFHAENKPVGFGYTYSSKEPTDFFPKKLKVNKDILQKINDLPVVQHDALNKLIKYDGFKMRVGKKISFHPGFAFTKNTVLFDMDDDLDYKPVKGMVEITTSEYKKLLEVKSKNKPVKKANKVIRKLGR